MAGPVVGNGDTTMTKNRHIICSQEMHSWEENRNIQYE